MWQIDAQKDMRKLAGGAAHFCFELSNIADMGGVLLPSDDTLTHYWLEGVIFALSRFPRYPQRKRWENVLVTEAAPNIVFEHLNRKQNST